jgi:hypothetical protein
MRIVIEIDGRPVVATEVQRGAEGEIGASESANVPAELVERARALGAQSAGRARFTGGAVPDATMIDTEVTMAAPAEDADADAGHAAAAGAVPAAPARRARAARTKGRRPKRG